MTDSGDSGRTSEIRIAGAYLVVGVIWILLSDRLLAVLVQDAAAVSLLQTMKGGMFVTGSALFLWWLVRREMRRVVRTESRFEALAGQGIVGTFAIQRGRLVHANRRLAEIFGYEEGEVLGMSPLRLVDAKDHELIRADSASEAEAGRGLVRRRFTGRRRDGLTLQAEVHGRVTDWGGEPAMAGILIDISDRVRLEERLRHAGRLEALGEITGAVAHDFNNFLTGILGNLDFVVADIAHDPRAAEESLLLVRDAASRAANLTSQLLAFSRGRSFQHRPLDVNQHLTKLGALLRSLCGPGQTLKLEQQKDIPTIMIDPVALDQLVMNLFVNAKQASGPGGTIVIRTRSRASSAGFDVFIEVEDDGEGMPPEVKERICEPFFTTKDGGTGLGLATVRSIMEEAHGHLVVDSEVGVGTVVRLLFPQAGHVLVREASPKPARVEQGRPGAGWRILVLDQDPAVVRLVEAALRRRGHSPVSAVTPEEALRVLHTEAGVLNLMIVDNDLVRGLSEFGLEDLGRDFPALPLLLTTGARTASKVYLKGRVVPVLTKPFSLERLLRAVQEAVGSEQEKAGQADLA